MNRQIDLEQLAEAPLETVLRAREVGGLRLGVAVCEAGLVVGAERVVVPDQPRLIRVDDLPVALPDLHPLDPVVTEDPIAHDGVEMPNCRGVAGEQCGAQLGLDDPLAGELRDALGVADGFVLTGAVE